MAVCFPLLFALGFSRNPAAEADRRQGKGTESRALKRTGPILVREGRAAGAAPGVRRSEERTRRHVLVFHLTGQLQ